jgi:hypothetical protein
MEFLSNKMTENEAQFKRVITGLVMIFIGMVLGTLITLSSLYSLPKFRYSNITSLDGKKCILVTEETFTRKFCEEPIEFKIQ